MRGSSETGPSKKRRFFISNVGVDLKPFTRWNR